MNFEKPEYKITEYVEKNNYGKFEIEPLERGFGTTIGNALRRVMLSSMPGSAITSVKINGVMHEFQKIDGIIEDVTTIVLNLKSVVIKNHTKENKTIRLSANKEGEVKAGDIELDADLEIMNPDLVICTLVKGGKIDMEMTVGNGRGYVDSKENKKLLPLIENWLQQMDSIFGHGNFFLELQPSHNKDQIYVNKALLQYSITLNIPYIITTDSHYLKKEDRVS